MSWWEKWRRTILVSLCLVLTVTVMSGLLPASAPARWTRRWVSRLPGRPTTRSRWPMPSSSLLGILLGFYDS